MLLCHSNTTPQRLRVAGTDDQKRLEELQPDLQNEAGTGGSERMPTLVTSGASKDGKPSIRRWKQGPHRSK